MSKEERNETPQGSGDTENSSPADSAEPGVGVGTSIQRTSLPQELLNRVYLIAMYGKRDRVKKDD